MLPQVNLLTFSMESAKYYILIGVLLLAMGLLPAVIKKLPITASIVYLFFGIAIGPHGMDIVGKEMLSPKILEVISEITVIVSLFTVGLKLRVLLSDRRWLLPISLASLAMILTVTMIAGLSYYFLDLSPGYAILLGAILAPTDPVLASEAQLKDPSDKDHLKFSLTAEGGFNDGTAFPFVMLGLGLIGAQGNDWTIVKWFGIDLIWAITAGIIIGAVSGLVISKLASRVSKGKKSFYLEDFLTIGSIALSYGLAIQVHAYGFLAVFANALTIRQVELKNIVVFSKEPHKDLPDDVLSFNEQLERIFEVLAVMLVGVLVDFRTFSPGFILLAMTLFFVIRPLSILTTTSISKISFKERLMMSWFGIRGIGSIYYLFYAINHGAEDSKILMDFTLCVVFCSILIHGFSVKPLMRFNN